MQRTHFCNCPVFVCHHPIWGYPHKWTSLPEPLLWTDVLVAAVGLWSSDGDWKSWYLSPRQGPRRHQAPLPFLWNLSPLVTGRLYNTQSFVSESIVGGRLREKGGRPGDRKARWNKKVWLCGLKRAGMDQRAGCWPAAFVRQTVLASFNLSLEATKAHWDIVLHRSHALWGQCLPASPSPIPLSPPPASTWDNIIGESGWEGLRCICASPQPVRHPRQRELSPLSGCPAAKSYLTLAHSHGLSSFPVLAPLGQPQREGNQNREELSISYLGMLSPSYVANKGELSGPVLYWLVGEI